jgi:hypothetical protein
MLSKIATCQLYERSTQSRSRSPLKFDEAAVRSSSFQPRDMTIGS